MRELRAWFALLAGREGSVNTLIRPEFVAIDFPQLKAIQ
jgi:hypothetical protein